MLTCVLLVRYLQRSTGDLVVACLYHVCIYVDMFTSLYTKTRLCSYHKKCDKFLRMISIISKHRICFLCITSMCWASPVSADCLLLQTCRSEQSVVRKIARGAEREGVQAACSIYLTHEVPS
jgi:hypothetical protein